MALTFGQDLDAMIEARNAREWEEQNAEPVMDVEDVVYWLGIGQDELKDGIAALGTAAQDADGFPAHARIMSLIGDIITIRDEITSLIARTKEAKAS